MLRDPTIIAGTFLKATMDEFVLVKIDGEMVDYLVRANPSKYSKFVSMQNGKKTIYLRLKRALYGCVKSSLLWWKLLTKTLTEKMRNQFCVTQDSHLHLEYQGGFY